MKLVIGIVNEEDSQRLEKRLVEQDIRVTKLASTGGFLRSGNVTFLSGVEDEDVEKTIQIYNHTCSKRKFRRLGTPTSQFDFSMDMSFNPDIEVEVGGAVVFVLDVDQFVKV